MIWGPLGMPRPSWGTLQGQNSCHPDTKTLFASLPLIFSLVYSGVFRGRWPQAECRSRWPSSLLLSQTLERFTRNVSNSSFWKTRLFCIFKMLFILTHEELTTAISKCMNTLKFSQPSFLIRYTPKAVTPVNSALGPSIIFKNIKESWVQIESPRPGAGVRKQLPVGEIWPAACF